MISHTILRKVIGTDFFTAIACTDLCQSIGSLSLCLFLFFEGEESSLQDRNCLHFILELGSFILTLNRESRRNMHDTDRGIRLVHMLPSCSTRSTRHDLEVFLSDLDIDIFYLGHDSDSCRRGMDPTIFLRTRDTLDTVDSRLELEPRIGSDSIDLKYHFLIPSGIVPGLTHDLDGIPLRSSKVLIGLSERECEKSRLIASYPCPNLEDDIFLVIRVCWEKCDLQSLFEFWDTYLSLCDLGFHELKHFWIFFIRNKFFHFIIIRVNILIFTVEIHGFFESFLFLVDRFESLEVRVDRGISEFSFEMFVFSDDIIELEFHRKVFRI